MRQIAFGVWLGLMACGEPATVAPDAAPPGDGSGGFETAAHTRLPLATPHTSSVLAHPKLVTITYANYPLAARVNAWADAVVTSAWWPAVGTEYGIGTMTHAASFTLGTAPTTTLQDTNIETQIKALIANNSVPTPPATGNDYLYMIFIPSTVPLGSSLADLYGYHAMVTTNSGTKVPYAVIVDDGTGIDTTTSTAAHELIEAATDPYTAPDDGWSVDTPLPNPWYVVEGEVGDLCNSEPLDLENGFAYQRIWSNAAAAAGTNPCIPNMNEPWQTVSAWPATMPTIKKGEAATFKLTGWSTQPVPDWSLYTADAEFSDFTDAQINPKFSASTINNGTSVTVTLHAPSSAASGSVGGVYILSGDYNRPWAVGYIVE